MAERAEGVSAAERRAIVLVDAADRELGEAPAIDCHVPPGRLHRAFTTIVLDADGRVLLARRAAGKMLWPGAWDATVASHPSPGESNEAAAARRLVEELGVTGALVSCPRFEYRAPFADVGVEHEVCRTLVARLAPGATVAAAPDEIDALRWEDPPTLLATIAERAGELCPWALLALLAAGACADALPAALRGHERLLRRALAGPFPHGGWRMLDAVGS
jgi:isopentenyl-diphosphate delta-isomerase